MKKTIIFLLIVVVVITVGCFCLSQFNDKYRGQLEGIHYFRISDGLNYNNSFDLLSTFADALKSKNISYEKASTYENTTFLSFETLNSIDQIIPNVKLPRNVKHIYALRGTDMLVSKSSLAIILRNKIDNDDYNAILPKTYITHMPKDMKQLEYDFLQSNNPLYIMKKNVQRQEGQILVKDLSVIKQNHKDYVVIQELLQDPLTVSGHKINMRVYVLCIVDKKEFKMFYYHNGFIYYTPKAYEKNSIDKDVVITTGYVDRKIYEDNPLTHIDLKEKIGAESYNKIQNGIKRICQLLKLSYEHEFIKLNKGYPGCKFLIYGMDIAPDNKYGCKLMEVNKGPDLTYKDERDKDVKLNMVIDAFRLVNLIDDHSNAPNGFIAI